MHWAFLPLLVTPYLDWCMGWECLWDGRIASGEWRHQHSWPGAQGWSLLLVGPFLDRYMSDAWVSHWEYHTTAVAVLMLSCICAVGVNISQFACLGRFSAVSFQARSQGEAFLTRRKAV